MFIYKTKGTCSSKIMIEHEGDVITHVEFQDGCKGNTQGVSRLCEGRRIDELIPLLEGIQCRGGTSCPDQLSKALKQLKETL